ncbi:MAG: hypothetical protein P9M06_01095 [Candidatus Saelkia tenebricola]|nr:hypothetical protein [Candidatus Saelkia tenebricola]
MTDGKPYYFNTSFFKIFLYKLVRYSLVILLSYIYFISWNWNKFLGVIMTLLFAYCVAGVISLVMHFVIYAFTKPKLIEGDQNVLKNKIAKDVLVTFFRPIFAGSNSEIESLLFGMEKDILNNKDIGGDQKYLVIDNTRNKDVRAYACKRITELQADYGQDKVFYLHRNHDCDFFKKVGILHDAIMFIYQGWSSPKTYLNDKSKNIPRVTRDPKKPIWDEILGDIKSLGIEGSLGDVLKGKDVSVLKRDDYKIAVVSDADNFWEKGEFIKVAAKILHDENKDFAIYQPSIELLNPRENKFVYLTYLARRMYEFEPIARWRLFGFSPFYGKGVFNLSRYVDEIIKTEWLNPEKSASHDFQEALRGWCVSCEDVFIYEKTFSNKLAELKRAAQWGWGDLETVRQFILKKFQPGRHGHLYVLLRGLMATLVYGIWLLLSVLFLETGVMAIKRPVLLTITLAAIVIMSIIVPKLLAPLANQKKKRIFKHELQEFEKSNAQLTREACYEVVVANFIHKLDLIYKPWAFIQNLIRQFQGRPFVWKTAASGELETQDMQVIQVYKTLWQAPLAGVIILGFILNGIISNLMAFILLPYYSSFILGPYFIWRTAKGFKE